MSMDSFVFIRNIFYQLPFQNMTQCDFERTGSVLRPPGEGLKIISKKGWHKKKNSDISL